MQRILDAQSCIRVGIALCGAQNSGLPDTPPAVLQCNRASSHRLQCDFIVMGGYGHSRMREFVLGGVTRSILRTMTAPVLMSH